MELNPIVILVAAFNGVVDEKRVGDTDEARDHRLQTSTLLIHAVHYLRKQGSCQR